MDGDIKTQERLEEIALDRIDPSPTNPRKRFDEVKLQELAESIRTKGLIAPTVARPTGDRFELVVGERRYRASKLAGCTTILVLVRKLTDREVAEVQLEENGQREDVHPLEEADAYQHLQQQGAPVEELAARTGKSVSYVRQRLQYCALCTEAREAFLDGKLTSATALLVARIPSPKLQADAVKEIVKPNYQGDAMTARDAGNHIRGRYMLQLAAAPFDRGDAALVPDAGACTTCPKRTGNQAELFADVQSPDTCIDPNCFAVKKDADWSKRTAEAKAKGVSVLSEKETKKVFQYRSHLAYDSEFVDIGEKKYEIAEGKKTIKAALKKHLPPVVLARDPNGGVHELVRKADLAKACKEAGIESKISRGSSSSSEEKKAREKMVLMRATQERALDSLVEEVQSAKVDHSFWLLLAQLIVKQGPSDTTKAVVKRRGIETGKLGEEAALAAAVEAMKDGPLRGLVIERLCAAPPYNYAGSYNAHLTMAAEAFGIDLKATEAEVKAELAAAKKAKAKKPPQSAKASTKKTSTPAKASKGAKPSQSPKKPAAAAPTTHVWIASADMAKLDAERLEDYETPDFDVTITWTAEGDYRTATVDLDTADLLVDMTVDDGIKLHRGFPPAELEAAKPAPVEAKATTKKSAAAAPGEHASKPHALDARATIGSPGVACLAIHDSDGTRCYPRLKARTEEQWRKEVGECLSGANMVQVARLYSQKAACVWDSRDSQFNGKPTVRFCGLAAGERITLDGAEVDVLWVGETELLWRGLGADAPKDGVLVRWTSVERVEGTTWRTKAGAS